MSEPMKQPWKNFWPSKGLPTIDPVAIGFTFPGAAGGGRGASPHEMNSADGTKVMRLDNLESFITSLKDEK